MPRQATGGDVPRREKCTLQARGPWFEPSCSHQVRGPFRILILVTSSERGAKRSCGCRGAHIGQMLRTSRRCHLLLIERSRYVGVVLCGFGLSGELLRRKVCRTRREARDKLKAVHPKLFGVQTAGFLLLRLRLRIRAGMWCCWQRASKPLPSMRFSGFPPVMGCGS